MDQKSNWPRFLYLPLDDGSPTLINLSLVKGIDTITPSHARLLFLDGQELFLNGKSVGDIIKFLMRDAFFLDAHAPPDFMNPAKP
jgi:hypothetical protein